MKKFLLFFTLLFLLTLHPLPTMLAPLPHTSYDDLALPKGGYDYQVSAKYDNDGGESANIGPVHVDIYTCFPPTNVQVANVTLTTTSAEVTWTASTITPNPEWIYEYGPAGFAHGTGIGGAQYINSPFITLNSLTPGTEYDFYIRTFCIVGDSSVWVKKTFRTHYFDCPVGATAELEACGDTTNNGCNLVITPAFEPLTCGETKCGTGFYNGSLRDTDWYLFILTETADVTWSGKAEFSYVLGFVASPCGASPVFLIAAAGVAGTTVSVTTRLAAGTYYAFAAPLFAEIVKCDSLDKYYAKLTCNTCLSPSELTATNITTTTADLGWTPGSTETAWEYVIGLSPLPVPTGAGIPTTVTLTPVSGLSASSSYCYYVRSSCGGGVYGIWIGPYCFSTLCDPFTLPHCEPFAVAATFPACWSQTYSGGVTTNQWSITASNYAGGTTPNEATCSWVDETGTVRLISGAYNTSGLSSVHLAFRQNYDDYNAGVNDVNIMLQSSPDGVTWTTQWTHAGGVGSSIDTSLMEIDIPVTGSTVYFAWTADGYLYDINFWYVDDICVSSPPPTTKTLNLKVYLEGLYDPGTGLMKQAMENNAPPTPHFGAGIADQVTVELHDATSPYAIAYTYSNVNLNTNGTLAITTIPGIITGSYYVVIKHRNSIETWSMSPVAFGGAGPVTYDFTTAASQAYGNNMKLMGTAYAIYGGDAFKDATGIVDASDMAMIDNASTAVLIGYNPEDVNGDGIVDASDMALIDNNSTAVVHAQKP